MHRDISTRATPSMTNHQPDRHAATTRRTAVGLHLLTLILLALHIYVRTLRATPEPIPTPTDPEAAWWGLWPITYLPPIGFWLGIAAVLTSIAWGLVTTLSAPANLLNDTRIDSVIPRNAATRNPLLLPLYTLSVLLIIAFYHFPIVHTRWGDAYILSQAIAWPDPALRLTYSWQAPLDVFLHSQIWLTFGTANGWQDAIGVYHLLSPIAGALYLAILLQLAADRTLAPAWFTFGLFTTLGLIQLFFGYIENYSFAAAGILAYLWLGRRALQGRTPLWLPALILGITNATHPSTIVLAPSMLYIAWVRGRAGTGSWARIIVETALPPILVAAGTLWLMESGGHGLAAFFTTDRPGGSDASWFVPLWGTSTRWETYTLLSWLHLRDLLNQMLLVAPVVLPALIWITWATRRPAADTQRHIRRFIAIAAVSHLLLIVVWNPDYGGQRDWDLFSLAWLPTTLWLASEARVRLNDATLRAGFVPLLILQAWHTAAWVYQNTLPWTWP